MLTIEVIRQTGETVIINPLHVVSLQEVHMFTPPQVSFNSWVFDPPDQSADTHVDVLTQIRMCNEREAIFTREPVAQVRRRMEQAIRELPRGHQYRDEPMYWHAGTVTHPDFWAEYLRGITAGANETIPARGIINQGDLNRAAMEIFREQNEVRPVPQTEASPPVKVPPKLPLPL